MRHTGHAPQGCGQEGREPASPTGFLQPDGPPAGARVLGGLNGASVARRFGAAARAAGVVGRITGHSGRIGLASELTRRGATTTETMLAGGWKTARMVAHYSAGATAERGAVAKYL